MRLIVVCLAWATATLPAAAEEEVPASPDTPWTPTERAARNGGIQATASALREGQPAADRKFALLELVDLALGRHPSTRQAWQNARQAAAQVGVARSQYYPTLTLDATAGKSYASMPTYPGFSHVDQWTASPQLSVTWLLLDFGGRHAGLEAARETLFSSNFQFNKAVQDVVFGVMQGYYTLDARQDLLKAAEANLALADAELENVARKAQAGLSTETDRLQALQVQAQAAYNLESARGDLKTAQATLARSLGFTANTPISIARPEGVPSLPMLNQQADDLVELALKQRPDLSAKYATLLSLKAQARQADAALWPKISADLTGARTFYDAKTDSNGKSFAGRSHYNEGSAMLTMSVDLFDGLNLVNRARAARAAAEAAQADLANSELSAIAEVVIDYSNVQTAAKKFAASQWLLDASRRSHESMQISYKAGLNSLLDLLTAQNNLSSAIAQNVGARSELLLSTAQLANATGSLLPPPRASPTAKAPPPKPETEDGTTKDPASPEK